MNTADIERAAMAGERMPDNLGTAEQLLYQKLRWLYLAYRFGQMTREQGRYEKAYILKQYQQDALTQRIYDRLVKLQPALGQALADANKSGCTVCMRLARLVDGRADISGGDR